MSFFHGDSKRWLAISDLQIPFQHPQALRFCKDLMREFRISPQNVLNCGDETDQYWGSLYDHDPNANLSAVEEIKQSKEILKEWYSEFPYMKLCTSNHGDRWKRKAFAGGIPQELMRNYEDVMESPDTWIWKKAWHIDAKFPFMIEHGDDWGGQYPHQVAAIHNGKSTIMGHHHSKAIVTHIQRKGGLDPIWGAVSGALIDFESYAFHYARKAKYHPVMGATVVIDDGRTPLFIPMGDN